MANEATKKEEQALAPLENLLRAVIHIAHDAPRQRGRYAGQAKVSWYDVQAIRDACLALGVDPWHWDPGAEVNKLLRMFVEGGNHADTGQH